MDNFIELRRNLYWNYGRSWRAPARDSEAVVADPQFVAAAAGNLSLGPNSAALDRATSGRGLLTVADDLTGVVQRPRGVAADLGALERP